MSDDRHIPLFETKRIFPTKLCTTETWISVALCYCGATVPVLDDHSLTVTGVMIAVLVVGFVAGLNVLISEVTLWPKLVVTLGVLFCAGKLFMVLIAGAQS
jgi:ribose/xylose/arabinose/galactoside ABC-type transport system permease subunit